MINDESKENREENRDKEEEIVKVQEIPTDITNEIKTAYINYAMSVIIGRAIPDARDGLKPVHRRV
ncbi:MAG: hypothetical protein WCY14_04810, partial [Arcobacteraceae bacterium]